MSDKTKIEWTRGDDGTPGATWNPVTGCTKVSPGCDHCYAETFAERWRGTPGHPYEHGFDLTLRPERLDQPLRWKRPRRIFVNSMSDLFHDDVPDEFIARVFVVMSMARQHTYQVLTKRHGRMRSLLGSDAFQLLAGRAAFDLIQQEKRPVGWEWPLPNVWLGVSVEDQQWADIRIPALLDTPAAVRWLSCEPLLGSVDLGKWLGPVDWPACWNEHEPSAECSRCIQPEWVVVGGESGPGARPMHPDWARSMRDQCAAADVPFFFKQWGEWAPAVDLDPDLREHAPEELAGGEYVCRVGKRAAGRELDGRTWDQYPAKCVPAPTSQEDRS